MKKSKIILFLISLFLFLPHVYAEKIAVTLEECVDGDTAKFKLNNKTITSRFLVIDTPETKHPQKKEEPWGKEASDFTCNMLKKANKIEIEYDGNKLDKYDRHLVWVFTDDVLLQDEIIKKGYAKVAYLYDDYKYTTILQDHEKIAQNKKLGIWGEYKINYWYIIITLTLLILVYLLGSKKTRKKIQTKVKKRVKKEIQNRL